MDQESVDKIVLQFLQTTVFNLGKISIQNLTGHFSQLPVDIRKKFNCTKVEVKKFLLAYPEVFVVNDEMVSILQKKDQFNLVDTSVQCEIPVTNPDADDDYNNSNDDETETVTIEKKVNLFNCKGRIMRLFDVYGFIEYTDSTVSTSIYFDAICFEDGRYENLFRLKVNEEIIFCAKKSVGHKAPYRATKVWRSGYSGSLQGSDRCYSSNTSLTSQDSNQSEMLNGSGRVMKITSNYGFIKPTGNAQGNVFFFRTKLHLPNAEEVQNLENVLKIGDFLFFSAIQSRKKNADAPWEAIKVSKTPLENMCNGFSKNCTKSNIRTGSTSSTDSSFYSAGLETEGIDDENHMYNQVGTIHNLASNNPLIHFGKNEKAIVPQNVIYKENKLLQEYGWEIDEGASVQFNAKYGNSVWNATLVWIGDKPQFLNKMTHRKKTTKVKESAVSDLSEISLYDINQSDQSDDGIWHTSSPHIDTSTWDEENSENWPALEPPVSRKRSTEKMKTPKPGNNSKIFNDRLGAVSSSSEEKCNDEPNTSNYSTALSGDWQEMSSKTLLKQGRKKKNTLNTNTSSYATVATALSKDSQQFDPSISLERLERYKMNNGWEKDSFSTKNEKWPALNESSISPISSVSKNNINASEEKCGGHINEHSHITQKKMLNELESSDFIDHNNGIEENYYSDSDGYDVEEIASDIACNKNTHIVNSEFLDKVSNPVEETNDKFFDLTGTVFNVQKYLAFIEANELDQNLPFCWEQAFCDGLLVSKHYSDLRKAFNESDRVNFTYCSSKDERGKESKNLIWVWKGKKPMETTRECIEDVSENLSFQQKLDNHTDASDAGSKCERRAVADVLKENHSTVNFSANTLADNAVTVNKTSIEDSGVCMEELEIHDCEDINKIASKVPNNSVELPMTAPAPCRTEEKREVKIKGLSSGISVIMSEDSQPRDTDKLLDTEKSIDPVADNFIFKYIYGCTYSKPDPVSSVQVLPSTQSEDCRVSVRNQETQTEIIMCDQGTQTFITGTVLSIEVFPH